MGFASTCVCLGRASIGKCTHVRASRSCCCWDLHSRKTGAQWSPGGPRRAPIVICSQSALLVRVGSGAVHVRDVAAIVIHKQHVDGCGSDFQSGRGAMSCRPVSCAVVSCRVCHFTSRRVASCHLSSCHVAMLCRVMSYHVRSCRIMSSPSCHVMSRRVLSRRVMSGHVRPCHVVSCCVLSCRIASCYVAKSGHNTLTQLPHSQTTQTHAALTHTAHVHTTRVRTAYTHTTHTHAPA